MAPQGGLRRAPSHPTTEQKQCATARGRKNGPPFVPQEGSTRLQGLQATQAHRDCGLPVLPRQHLFPEFSSPTKLLLESAAVLDSDLQEICFAEDGKKEFRGRSWRIHPSGGREILMSFALCT